MLIGAACSVQFTDDRALMLRVVSVGEVDPYHDWIWLTGYVLEAKGLATSRRELYVMKAGVCIQRRTPVCGQPRLPGSRKTVVR